MANTTYYISGTGDQLQLTTADQQKVNTVELSAQFDPSQDIAEASVYNSRGQFVNTTLVNVGLNLPSPPQDPNQSNEDRDLTSSTIFIDAVPLVSSLSDFEKDGATAKYCFYRPILSNLEADEISYDRTEVKVRSISFGRPQAQIDRLIELINNSAYYGKIGISHPEGAYTPIINVIDDGEYVYLKLYRPLPDLVNLGDSININQEVADPVTVTFNYTPDAPEVEPLPSLRSPNFNIDLDDRATVTTEYLDYNTLYSLPVTNSYNRVFSELEGLGVGISVDYTNYENFIHFSSAKERLANFKYKLDLLHQYEQERADAAALSNAANAITSSNLYYDNLIKGILTKFDGYERYLYYESSSKAWPKSNAERPYINVSSSLSAASSWYTSEQASASLYDELNESNLEYTIPEFIRQDSNNAPYSLFLNMIGQHFDELWLYAKGMTDRYDADNRLDFGISKDLIAKTLQSFGVKLYSSNFSTSNLTNLFLGEWMDTGSEQINTFVTASNEPTPDSDILSETYKRIYHNLPYLIKTKGTERGLRALINCFGIPSGSLSIEVFGGLERNDSSYFGYEQPSTTKIKLDNTGSIIPGDTLSQYTSIIKPYEKYNQDLHVVEVGFTPTKYMDEYIKTLFPGKFMLPLDYAFPYLNQEAYVIEGDFNLDEYIGDPRYRGQSNYKTVKNASLLQEANSVVPNSGSYDVNDFIRLVKFFDNQLFKMVRDFVPARDTVSAGIIIKPTILDRAKVPTPVFSFTQPEYSGSINTAFITGSAAGILDQHSTAYTASVLTPSGSINKIYDDEAAQINGELGGTVLDMYSGSLNEANELKKPSTILPIYEASGSTNVSPTTGQFTWQYGTITRQQGGLTLTAGYGVTSIYINEIDSNDVNLENVLENLTTGDELTFTVDYKYYDLDPFSPGPTGPVRTKTVTQTIENISSTAANTWYITFTNSSIDALVGEAQAILYTVHPLTRTSTSVIFNPFINVENIDYHPYNATLNNATKISNAAFLQEVDYSTGNITPINLSQILENEAVKAEVSEYIHNSAGMVRGKYTGKQLTAAELSKYTTGDTSYGKTPVINYTGKYFAYAPDLERTDPLVVGKTQYTVRYLIDDNREVLDLTAIEETRKHVSQNYRENTGVAVRLQNPRITALGAGANYYLVGDAKVYKAGKRPEYILGTEVTLGEFATGDITFEGTSITNYSFLAELSSGKFIAPTYSTVVFNNEISDDGNDYSNSTGIYTFDEDSEARVSFITRGTLTNIKTQAEDATIRIVRDRGGNDTVIKSQTFTVPSADISLNAGIKDFQVQSGLRYFEDGDKVRVEVQGAVGIDIESGSEFFNTQAPQASANINATSLWTTGSSTGFSLTSSAALANQYGTNIQEPLSGSSFPSASLLFTLERGDEFRFGGSEDNVYVVLEAKREGLIYVVLNKPLNPAININQFTVRRFVDDTTSLITNQKKLAGDTSPAFILPEHTAPDLNDNLDAIIKDLVGQNLI